MELTDENLLTLSSYLSQTLSPDSSVRLPAEAFLQRVEVNQNYPLLLLHLVEKAEIDLTIRTAAAVAFKNYVKRNWDEEENGDRIHAADRAAIKMKIVDLMLFSPNSIQKQLSDAITVIGKHDFPDKWPELIGQMVEKFNTPNFHIICGVLHTAHSLFKRYRYSIKSQELWTEIKYVLDQFAKPLTDLFVATMELTQKHANDPVALKVIYNSLLILCKVFYSLNFQDLPEFFEDNMETWMKYFHTLLTTDVPALQSSDPDEASVIEQLKTQVCDNVELYAKKYEEEFQPYLPQFVTDIWNLLITTGQQTKYDGLVSNALIFLATVVEREKCKELFDPNTLSSICEKVIIPNMEFRESDNELFEDNAEEYIRRDIEGSDVDTRRRAACDLVREMSAKFEDRIMEIFSAYIQAMLQSYAQSPSSNWRSKNAAMYLITSSSSKGQTQKLGVTQCRSFVNLSQFAADNVLPEINMPNVNELPVIKADSIKFLMMFRSVLQREVVVGSLPQVIRHLAAKNMVVHSYAACAIDRILSLKDQNNASLVKPEESVVLAPDLLKGLFHVLTIEGSEENEYAMKAIMTSFVALQENIVPFLSELIPKLTQLLIVVAKNPSRPRFNHYLFETLSLSIKILCRSNPAAVASFEQALFPIFQEILQQDIQVSDFMTYVFQLLALLLELQTTPSNPDPYMSLFPCLLSPVLFANSDNIPSLSRLLQAFVCSRAQQIIAEDKLTGLLGVYQKLIASRVHDRRGFLLMQDILEHFDPNVLQPYIKQIFVLIFQRLSTSKTNKFMEGLIVFFSFYIIKFGSTSLIQIIDNIQPQMFGMVVERVFIANLNCVGGVLNNNRKIAAVGMSNLLMNCQEMLNPPYNAFYPKLLSKLIEYLEESQKFFDKDNTKDFDKTHFDTEEPIDLLRLAVHSYNSELVHAKKPNRDPVGAVGDIRLYLARGLGRLSPGQLPQLLTSIPSPNARRLESYLQTAGVAVM